MDVLNSAVERVIVPVVEAEAGLLPHQLGDRRRLRMNPPGGRDRPDGKSADPPAATRGRPPKGAGGGPLGANVPMGSDQLEELVIGTPVPR
jgi:hypothetical protein